MQEKRNKVRKELDHRSFEENPIEELIRIMPDSRVEQTAIDRLNSSEDIVFFLKRYVDYSKENRLKALMENGGAENLVLSDVSVLLSMGCSAETVDLWSEAIKQAQIFNYLLK